MATCGATETWLTPGKLCSHHCRPCELGGAPHSGLWTKAQDDQADSGRDRALEAGVQPWPVRSCCPCRLSGREGRLVQIHRIFTGMLAMSGTFSFFLNHLSFIFLKDKTHTN